MSDAQATVEGTATEEPQEAVVVPAAEHAHAQPSAELVTYSPGRTELIVAASPQEKLDAAKQVADVLNDVIVQSGARTKVGRAKVVRPDGREEWVDRYHVNVEGWQTLATLLGVALVERYVRAVVDPATGQVIHRTIHVTHTTKATQNKPATVTEYDVEGHDWEAVVDAVKDGVVIGTGSAICSRAEPTWHNRDEYALRSMAATRATSRAMKQAAAWVVTLAGYSATPAEEMPPEAPEPSLPWYGEAASPEAVTKAGEALLVLLGDDTTAALKVAAEVRADAGGAIPRAVARALMLAAKQRKALDEPAEPEQQAA